MQAALIYGTAVLCVICGVEITTQRNRHDLQDSNGWTLLCLERESRSRSALRRRLMLGYQIWFNLRDLTLQKPVASGHALRNYMVRFVRRSLFCFY